MSICQTFREESEIEQGQVSQVAIAFTAEGRRHLSIGLFEDIADVSQAFSVVILDSIEVVGMDEFDQKVRNVIDGIFVAELEFIHTALRQLMKHCSDGMIIGY